MGITWDILNSWNIIQQVVDTKCQVCACFKIITTNAIQGLWVWEAEKATEKYRQLQCEDDHHNAEALEEFWGYIEWMVIEPQYQSVSPLLFLVPGKVPKIWMCQARGVAFWTEKYRHMIRFARPYLWLMAGCWCIPKRYLEGRGFDFGFVGKSRKLAAARGGAGLSPTRWFFTRTPKLPGHFEAVLEADGHGLKSCQVSRQSVFGISKSHHFPGSYEPPQVGDTPPMAVIGLESRTLFFSEFLGINWSLPDGESP